MMSQLAALTAQVTELLEEIRQLRRENYDLRRQVEVSRGLQQHDPYALRSQPTGGTGGSPAAQQGDISMNSGLPGSVRHRTPPPPSSSTGTLATTSPFKSGDPEQKRVRSWGKGSSTDPSVFAVEDDEDNDV